MYLKKEKEKTSPKRNNEFPEMWKLNFVEELCLNWEW